MSQLLRVKREYFEKRIKMMCLMMMMTLTPLFI